MQPFDEVIDRFSMTYVSNNAAHEIQLSVTVMELRI